MANLLFDMISKPALISTINSAVQSQAPDWIQLDGVGGAAHISLRAKSCFLGYKIEGELGQCAGLRSVALLSLVDTSKDAVRKNANGDIEVSLSPSLTVGGIHCAGRGRASGSACGANVGASASASARASVSRITATVRGRMEQGRGANQGKMCLKVLSIDADVKQSLSAVRWSHFVMHFSGLMFTPSDSVVNRAFEAMPLDKPINKTVVEHTVKLKAQLDKMNICVPKGF